jgi:hypothetical protein
MENNMICAPMYPKNRTVVLGVKINIKNPMLVVFLFV